MAYRIRYRGKTPTAYNAARGAKARVAIACAALLAMAVGSRIGEEANPALRQWLLPGRVEQAAMAYADGVSAGQVLLSQCRLLLKEAGYG